MLADARSSIAAMGPPTGEIWVTETNYNIPMGPVISEADAPGYINGTYAQADAQGVGNVYWYGWSTAASIGGLNINLGTQAWESIKSHA
jgi:hypothetical protein